jgi:hypothetical protein
VEDPDIDLRELKILYADSHPGSKKGTSWLSLDGRDGRFWRLFCYFRLWGNTLESHCLQFRSSHAWCFELCQRHMLVSSVPAPHYSASPLPMAEQPLVGHGLFIIEASRSHSDTPHSVGLLWMRDRPDLETSTWQHATIRWDRHPCPREDSNPQSQQVSGRKLTP